MNFILKVSKYVYRRVVDFTAMWLNGVGKLRLNDDLIGRHTQTKKQAGEQANSQTDE